MENIAALLRGIIGDAAKDLPDIALVGGAAGAVVLVLIILFALIGAMAGGSKKKKQREEEQYVEPPRAAPSAAQRARERAPEPQRAPQPAPQRAAQPAPQATPDPVQKIQRDAESGVARVKQDTERLIEMLMAERDKAVQTEKPFAGETPTRGFQLLAQKLTATDAPALGAARRRIASGDFDGARADLRRYVQEVNGRDGAWRDLAVLESLQSLDAMLAALEQARAAEPKDFVTLVMLRRIYSGINRPEQASEVGKAAVDAAQNDRERAIALDELGIAYIHMKDVDGARKVMLESLEIVERLAAAEPNDIERQRDVAVGQYKLASLGGPDSRARLVASIGAFEHLAKVTTLPASDVEALTQLKALLADLDKEAAKK
jgi:tetratricopeptide (TPR) repeat protein